MGTDKVLLVKGIAGLGNRMQCALTGILYALLSGRRLVIDWGDTYYSRDGTNAFHRFFDCPLYGPDDTLPDTDSVAPSFWRGRLAEPAAALRDRYGNRFESLTWRTFSIDLGRLDYPEEIAVLWTYDLQVDPLRPYLQGPLEELSRASRQEITRRLLPQYLVPRPEVRERVASFVREHFAERTVGVHVRYSDFRTNLWGASRTLDAVTRADPGLGIFLSTDSLPVKMTFDRQYGRVVSTPHWYAETPGAPLHTGSSRPDPMARGLEALIDLYLLAECTDLIVDTSSSFSYLATMLTRAPADRIRDVKWRDKAPARRRMLYNRLARRTGLLWWGPGVLSRLARRT